MKLSSHGFRIAVISLFAICYFCQADHTLKISSPGERWYDSKNEFINAHGGCLIYHQGVYYFYGELKGDSTFLNKNVTTWECYRTDALGVSCYSSKDLSNWKFESVALASDSSIPDLDPSQVIERPKVVYNEQTQKFVMWVHLDNPEYTKAKAGVAIADTPQGPFKFIRSIKPNESDCRDQTLFKDDDGLVYHIYSSENNATLHIALLDPTYTNHTTMYRRVFENRYREAPAMFKHNEKYYLITSGCTGWVPNEADLAVSDNIWGEWSSLGNPCKGEEAEKTFNAQSCYVFSFQHKGEQKHLAMFDQWNKKQLKESRYVWLPVDFSTDTPSIHWQSIPAEF